MNTQSKAMAYLTAVVVAITLLVAPNWSAVGSDSHGNKLWGTWYVTFDVAVGADIPAVLTIHRDGTLVSSDGSDFGGPPFPVRSTPLRGVWVKIGAGRFAAGAIYLNGEVMTGELVNLTRARVSIQFGDDSDRIRGTLSRDIFECPTPFTCPNPLMADPDTTIPPIPFQGTRLRVELEGDDGDEDDD